MATLIFQYLAVYNIENVPKSIRKFPNKAQNFSKYLMYPLKFSKNVFNFV